MHLPAEVGLPRFLMHEPADDVGVALEDLQPGVEVAGGVLRSNVRVALTPVETIPYCHKVAIRDLARGEVVIEYSAGIGVAVADIRRGAHVHVHNLRSLRWPSADDR